jgi:hypothetical protein
MLSFFSQLFFDAAMEVGDHVSGIVSVCMHRPYNPRSIIRIERRQILQHLCRKLF